MTTVAVDQFSQAQARRLERARLRRKLKRGEMSLAAALDHPAMQTMLVFDVLLALPGKTGPRPTAAREVKKATLMAQSLFAHIQRGPLARVEALTDRECTILVYAYHCHMERSR